MTTALLPVSVGRSPPPPGRSFTPTRADEAGGGCINRAFLLESGGERYFVKLNDAERLPMFEAEAEGLKEMAATKTVRVPMPLCSGVAEGQAFLVLEHLSLRGTSTRAQETLGRQPGADARVTAPTFGWRRDNTIGSTPQPNTPMADWVAFWRDQRLGFQLQLAANNGGRTLQRKGERNYWNSCRRFSPITVRWRRCCTAISGAAMPRRPRTTNRWSSTRRCTTAIARRISP